MSELFQTLAGVLVAVLTLVASWFALRKERVGLPAAMRQVTAGTTEPSARTQELTTLERVRASGVLRVGAIVADPWFFWDGRAATGLYADLFNDIAARHGLTVIYQPVRNNKTIDLLNERKIDVVASLLHTVERAKRADFTGFIHNVALVAVTRKDQAKIRVLGDLKTSPVRCAVVKGEIGAEVAAKYYGMTAENDRAVEVDTMDVTSIFYPVAQGLVDVAITTGARWVEFTKRDPEAAAKLQPIFRKPLLLVPAGCMIRIGEREFAEWLERETELSRAKADMRKREEEWLADFNDAIEAI